MGFTVSPENSLHGSQIMISQKEEREGERESTYRVTKCQHIGKLNVVGIK